MQGLDVTLTSKTPSKLIKHQLIQCLLKYCTYGRYEST